MSDLPAYIDEGSLRSFGPPYIARNVALHGFFLKGDSAEMNRLCDEFLNRRLADPFRPISNLLLLTFESMDVTLEDTPGILPVREMALWIPVVQKRSLNVRLFIPYMYIDTDYGMFTGRDVLGFPKSLAEFQNFPGDFEEPDTWRVSIQAFASERANERLKLTSLLEVHRTDSPSPPLTRSPGDSIGEIADLMTGQDPFFPGVETGEEFALQGEKSPGSLLRHALRHWTADTRTVLLKQHRDAARPERACFQKVVDIPGIVERIEGFRWLDREYRLRFPVISREPVYKLLGAQNQILLPRGFRLKFDFRVENGEYLPETFSSRSAPVDSAGSATGSSGRRRLAVLGGGLGSMAALFALLRDPARRARYEVTLYQTGWRLGGKGASGINTERNGRIEEHGLHVFLGFYHHALRLMKDCFDELESAGLIHADEPIQRFDQAFRPQTEIVLQQEDANGEWRPWFFHLGNFSATPRTDPAFSFSGDSVPERGEGMRLLRKLLVWIARSAGNILAETEDRWNEDSGARNIGTHLPVASGETGPVQSPPETGEEREEREDGEGSPDSRHFAETLGAIRSLALEVERERHTLLEQNSRVWPPFARRFANRLLEQIKVVADMLGNLKNSRWERKLILLELALVHARGLIQDEVFKHGFDSIDDVEYRVWLSGHGLSETTLNSAPVRAVHELAFAYLGGDTNQPNMAAGVAIRGVLRLIFDYRRSGAVIWRMQAGMGDIIFAPLYRLLRHWGVHFRFFHRVEHLKLSSDRNAVDTIRLRRQVRVKAGDEAYEPLIRTHEGQPAWPAKPRFEQLEQGEVLREKHREDPRFSLESPFFEWPPSPGEEDDNIELRRGRDFDEVILGISHAGLGRIDRDSGKARGICKELIEADPGWREMMLRVKTVRTQAFQIWLQRNATELGWRSRESGGAPPGPLPASRLPVMGTYEQPYNTFMDMSHLLPREAWSAGESGPPRGIAYFCGHLADDPNEPLPGEPGAAAYPGRVFESLREDVLDWLRAHGTHIWPRAARDDGRGLDFAELVAPSGTSDSERLAAQYLRANIDPTERYVLSVAGSTRARLGPGARPAGRRLAREERHSGFDNLYLVGDWVYTALNAGCAEACVLAAFGAIRSLLAKIEKT